MTIRTISLLAALSLFAAPALADGANESSESTFFPEPGTTEVALPRSTVTDTEALALPEPEMEAAAPAYGCRQKLDETVYLTN
jgi:hypothetical protein